LFLGILGATSATIKGSLMSRLGTLSEMKGRNTRRQEVT
jgi:hypothetical protein